MSLTPDDVLRIVLAIVAGGIIGVEREFRDKAAGFRTLIFICVGAALFTIFSAKLAGDNDPTRIAANIVSGVGFLGAGVILREGRHVVGLTTASTVWLTAALGMGLGGGQYALTAAVVGMIVVVLWVFPRIEQWIDNIREERLVEVVCAFDSDKLDELEAQFRECGLRIRSHAQEKLGANMRCSWHASGRPASHERMSRKLLADAGVLEFKY